MVGATVSAPSGVRTVVVLHGDSVVADVVARIVDGTPGFRTVASSTRVEGAVAALGEHHPDLVVIGHELPGVDGPSLVRELRVRAPATRFIMVAAESTGRALVESLLSGCEGFVHTARQASELVDTLRSVAAGDTRYPTDAIADLPRLDELVVHYQPVVDLESGGVVETEALVRWDHPLAGLRSPAEFLPQADATGLIGPIGWHVLDVACRQVSAWRAQLPDAEGLSVAVNVSIQQLAGADVVDHVMRALEAAELPGDALVMEVTETSLMAADRGVVDHLRAVAALGVGLRVDDFGTGQSSLVNLRRLPIGALKIDYEFVNAMLSEAGAADVVGAIIGLAHSLGMRSLAEGVENEQEAAQLRSLGCELGQGYVWSPPLEATAFASWYGDRLRSAKRRTAAPGPGTTSSRAGKAQLTYEHCGWCHFRGAYLVPGRPIVRCKYCQARMDVSAVHRSTVVTQLKTYTRQIEGRRTAEQPGRAGACRECEAT